jgi:hypothetical protein
LFRSFSFLFLKRTTRRLLTALQEKCTRYWPEIEQTMTFGAADGSAFLTVDCALQQRLAPDVVRTVITSFHLPCPAPLALAYEGIPRP